MDYLGGVFKKTLTVLLIIILLSFKTYEIVTSMTIHCSYNQNKVLLRKLDIAIHLYREDTGNYPITLNQLLTDDINQWDGPYIKERELLTPWGKPQQYLLVDETIGYFLFNQGKDNQLGGELLDLDVASNASLPVFNHK